MIRTPLRFFFLAGILSLVGTALVANSGGCWQPFREDKAPYVVGTAIVEQADPAAVGTNPSAWPTVVVLKNKGPETYSPAFIDAGGIKRVNWFINIASGETFALRIGPGRVGFTLVGRMDQPMPWLLERLDRLPASRLQQKHPGVKLY